MKNISTEQVRDSCVIAKRALALFGAVGLSLGAPRRNIIDWLKAENLWDELSPVELAYVSAKRPTSKQQINASWWSERLTVLYGRWTRLGIYLHLMSSVILRYSKTYYPRL
jgi:hypothetical protein